MLLMKEIPYKWCQIGIIHTPHKMQAGTPIQPFKAMGIKGVVELEPFLIPALQDLTGFERIWLIYWFHKSKPAELTVKPYLDDTKRGLFATRTPNRINPIGISPVRLLRVEANCLEVEDVDMLDGTPLLDIKPYAPKFDCFPEARFGWLEQALLETSEGKADNQFHKG